MISTEYNPVTFAGDDSTTVFTFPHPLFERDDLVVSLITGGIETVKTLDTDYTVILNLSKKTDIFETATVTFTVAPSSSDTVKFKRETSLITQPNEGTFLGSNEGQHDRLLAQIADVDAKISSSTTGTGMVGVESIADLPSVTSEPDRIWVDSYYKLTDNKGNAGGGMLFKDQDGDPADADGAHLFAIGDILYRRGDHRHIAATELGLYDSSTVDQSVKLQDLFDIGIEENYRIELDVDVNCDGAEIYANTAVSGLDRWDGINFQGFTIMGATRRYTQILRTMFSIGSANTAYDPGSGTKNYMRTSASNNLHMQWIHLEGALNLYNIEGSLSLDHTNVFASREMFTAEGGCQTYAQLKQAHIDRWPAGAGREIDGGFQNTHIVEMLYCNHPRIDTCNIRNGNFYPVNLDIGSFPDKANYILKGMSAAQCGNLLMTGGGVARNYGGLEFVRHPVYSGSGAKSLHILGTHFEANRRSALVLERITEADIKAHMRGSPASNPFAWDTDYPLIQIDTGTAKEINIHSHMVGVASDVGTAIKSVRCNGLTIGGEIRRFKTIADLSSNTSNVSWQRITYSEIGQGTEFVVHSSSTPWQLDKSLPANVTSININKKVVTLHDDFLGTALDANWTLSKGSDGDAADFAIVAGGTNGEIAATTGSTTNSMAGSGVQIVTEKNYLASQGNLTMETRVKLSSAAGQVRFVGFVDANNVLAMPFTYSGTTLTPNTTDFDNAVGFLYDTDGSLGSSETHKLVGMKADAESFVDSDTTTDSGYHTYRIDISTAGKAGFFIDGTFVGDIGNKITDPYFDSDPSDWTFGTGWARVDPDEEDDEEGRGAYAQHTAGNTAAISIPITVDPSVEYTVEYTVSACTAGTLKPRFTGGTAVEGTNINGSDGGDTYTENLVVHSGGNTTLEFSPNTNWDGRLDSVTLTWTGLVNAVDAAAALTPYIGVYRHSATAKTITADYITVEQKR